MLKRRFHCYAVSMAAVFLLLDSGQIEGASPAFHGQVSASNPLLWYQLSEPSGNAVNFGSLGATYDGVYFGTVDRAASTLGGDAGAGFNSTDDYIESLGTSPLVGNPTFSIETLIFLPAGGTAALWGPFLHWGDGGGGDGDPQRTGHEVYFSAQNANLNRTYAGFYNAGQRTASLVPLGEWLHIVWTRTGGNNSADGSTLYINGASVALEQDPNLSPGLVTAAGINVNSTTFRINRARDYLGTRHFTGTMDEIALYDRVLSATEVRDHACTIEALCGGAAGDYNGSGIVDAADYTVWRDSLGSTTNLAADGNQNGSIDSGDYDVWKANYGNHSGSGASANAAVPEPSTRWMLLVGILTVCLRRRATAS
jgi:concanavalin A-like lectin/glucanase superfamily protein